MEDEKTNKSMQPANNKQVRIKMRPGRAVEGLKTDVNGFAFVDAKTAERLVKMKYATLAEEK